jgi:hypothetical protein
MRIPFLAAILTLTAAPALAQGPFEGCGTIIQGVTCPRLFQADAGGIWLLSNIGSAQVGDRVRVVGTLDPTCITICQQGGCILNNTIGPCEVCNCQPSCDGSGTFGPCPCNVQGAPGHGCPNSLNPQGALLAVSGNSFLSNDTVRLSGSGMPDAPVLYFQADQGLAVPVPFGDGTRCAGGTLVRLWTRTNVGGVSQIPGPGDVPLSVRGLVGAPATREYQAWYRNAASFCTPDTFNLTNGVVVVWGA